MSSIAKVFTRGFHKDFDVYYSLWQPNTSLEIGTVGELRGGSLFVPIDTLQGVGIDFDASNVLVDDSPSMMSFSSSRGVSTRLLAGADVNAGAAADVKAGMRVELGSEGSFIMTAQESYEDRIHNLVAIQQGILAAYKAKRWERNWAVVSAVMRTPYADIIVARSAGASVDLEAAGNVKPGQVRLGDASVGFNVSRNEHAVYNMLGSRNVTPAFRLVGLRRRLFGSTSAGPLLKRSGPAGMAARVETPRMPLESEFFVDELSGDDPFETDV